MEAPARLPHPAPLWVFGLAFGLIEAAIVVYLRALLGLEGDLIFPLITDLSALHVRLLGVELSRELATLVLMGAVAGLYHPRPFVRFVAYMLVFGVWDLAYYGFLEVFLAWPAGPGTYDVLFLLPTVWVAPVWAPALIAATMVAWASAYLHLARTRPVVTPGRRGWAVAVAGGALVLVAFMADSGYYLQGGMPPRFHWPLFLAGYALALAAGLRFLIAYRREAPAREA